MVSLFYWSTFMSNPQNFNNLYNVKFKLDIRRIPGVSYWIQSCILPSMSIEGSVLSGMRRDIPIPGQKAEFETFVVNFIVDDTLTNYEEVYNWFQDIATASTLSEMVSDCSLHFLDGNNSVARTMDIVGAYPMLMTELSMNSDDSDVIPITCSLTFNYQYFKFSDSKKPIWAIKSPD